MNNYKWKMEAGAAPMTEEVYYNQKYRILGTEEQLRDCLWAYSFSEDEINDIISSSIKTIRIIKEY